MPETVDRARWPDVASANRSTPARMPARMRTPSVRARFQPLRAPSAIAVSGLLLLSACSGTDEGTGSASAGEPSVAAEEPNELLVLEWSGYEEPDFWTDFAEANPTRTSRSSSATPTPTSSPRWRAAARPTSSTSTPAGSSSTWTQGLVQEIDTSKLDELGQGPRRVQGARARSTASSTSSRGTGASPRSSTTPSTSTEVDQLGRPLQRGLRRTTSRCGMTAPAP